MQIYKPGMAWTGRILQTSPISGADNIVRAEVGCGAGGRWSGVVSKGTPDHVVVFLADSIIKPDPALTFMEKHGWRVKMMRLRGCPSEVLIVPATQLNVPGEAGVDVTEQLGVMKYEKEIPANLAGDIHGAFPAFIPKTDEQNFQKVSHFRSALVGQEVYLATKYDGSSNTFFHRGGDLGGCGRNWRLKSDDKTAVWQLAIRHGLTEKLGQLGNLALQWECVGPGIQGNPLKLKSVEARVFDIFDIDAQKYLDLQPMLDIINQLGMEPVEHTVLEYRDFSDDELRDLARGQYQSGKTREGIVVRPTRFQRVDSERLSFKVINLDYKEV